MIERAKIEALERERVAWRVQSARKSGERLYLNVFPYLPGHAIHAILDDLVGPDNWESHLAAVGDLVTARLSVFFDGKRRYRMDTAPIMEKRGASEEADPLTTATSRAIKRAALQWGIGRTCKVFGVRAADIVWSGANWNDVPEKARSAFALEKIKVKIAGKPGENKEEYLIVAWNPPAAWRNSAPASSRPATSTQTPPRAKAGEATSIPQSAAGTPGVTPAETDAPRDLDPLLRRVPLSFDERRQLLADLVEYGRVVRLADWSRELLSNAQYPSGPTAEDIRTFRQSDAVNEWFNRKLVEMISAHGHDVEDLAEFRRRPKAPAGMTGAPDDLPF